MAERILNRSQKVKQLLARVEKAVEPVKGGYKNLFELEQTDCRWPYGGQAPYRFCGCRVFEGLSYCEAHARLAYQPYSRRKAA